MSKKKKWYKKFWTSTVDWWSHRNRLDVSEPFEQMKLSKLLPGDVLLFYYGNKLTEAHGEWLRSTEFGHAKPAPFHAAIVYGQLEDDVIILDPEVRTTLSTLEEYMSKSSCRIDVVRFKATKKQRKAIAKTIQEVAKKEGYYDVKGYGAFASQIMPLRWLKEFIKPSRKTFYCSDAAAYCCEKNGIKVSPRGHNITAPVDILLYSYKHHDMYTIKKRGE